ncbi:MAG: DNA replication/repair protein RecF [Deltaproteobacteria bacterium]|nr:DNA replication/repair protein RecF [Deltaproteobacteria bacterium]
MRIAALEVEGVRNLAPLVLSPSPRFNVFVGDNGQGKTNLLESIYVAATLRSFRTTRLAEIIQFGAPGARIRARVERGGLTRLYDVTIGPHSRQVRLDGKAPRPVSRYFGDLNVVLFAPEDLHLPRGAPADRRRFLDRAVFNRRGEHLTVVADYDKALRSRNALLREAAAGRRTKGIGDQLAVWDEQVATLGARVIAHRRAYLAELRGPVQAAFDAIARAGKPADVTYASAAPEIAAAADADLPAALRAALAATQARDLARGSTSVGPHRDDLAFGFDGHEAAAVASQGQLRALVLAWKTAEIDLLERVHGEPPILLLDDVSSELDPQRNRYLFEYLAERQGQCFITTTHAGFVLLDRNRVDHQVRDGRIV